MKLLSRSPAYEAWPRSTDHVATSPTAASSEQQAQPQLQRSSPAAPHTMEGSTRPADAAGASPTQRRSRRMRELFDSIDVDASGQISSDELLRWLRVSLDLEKLNEHEFERDVCELNRAARSELRAAGVSRDQKGPVIQCNVSQLLEITVDEFFSAFDRNGNGQLSFNEFAELMGALVDEENGNLAELLGNLDSSTVEDRESRETGVLDD